VIRQLNVSIRQGVYKEALLEPLDALGITLVARMLERIADNSSRICEQILKLDAPLRKPTVAKLIPLGEFDLNMVDSAMLALFKRDHVGADLLLERKKQFFEMAKSARESLDLKQIPEEAYPVQVILESLGRIVEVRRGHRRSRPEPDHRARRQARIVERFRPACGLTTRDGRLQGRSPRPGC
jgi:hypothetical protein